VGVGFGTQNNAAISTGQNPAIHNVTEEFNGTTWSIGGNIINGRAFVGSAGAQTSGLAFSGQTPTTVSCTELYTIPTITTTCILTSVGNVVTNEIKRLCEPGQLFYNRDTNQFNVTINGGGPGVWSNTAGISTTRTGLSGAGTQNAALAFGGYVPGPTASSCTEKFNGYSWSTSGAMITARYLGGGVGTQNAALAAGGYTTPTNVTVTCTEKYNGSTWATTGGLITAKFRIGMAGTQNAGLAFGGYCSINVTEKFNGAT